MHHELDQELEHYLDSFTGFSDQQAAKLALGFRKIYTKQIMSIENEQKNLLYNQKYQYEGGAQGSDKPISKIVE